MAVAPLQIEGIYIFVSTVPVLLDTCFKYWIFVGEPIMTKSFGWPFDTGSSWVSRAELGVFVFRCAAH